MTLFFCESVVPSWEEACFLLPRSYFPLVISLTFFLGLCLHCRWSRQFCPPLFCRVNSVPYPKIVSVSGCGVYKSFITQLSSIKNMPSRQVMRAFSRSTQPCSLCRFNLPFTFTLAQISSPSDNHCQFIVLSINLHLSLSLEPYFMLLDPPTLINNKGILEWMNGTPPSVPHCSAS